MARPFSSLKTGFTLLEVILALLIAALVITVAIPSLTGVLKGSPKHDSFADFDAMVQEAHDRSVEEGRNYVMVWGREKTVRLRPEEPANQSEAEGIQTRNIQKGETLELHLPAALTEKGATPDAIWTFWSSGVCEPAEIRAQGIKGGWRAVYNPFTIQAEVHYE
ncbi:MAG: type II secretion system protein [Verrucomicrobia bacterium]|nr:type II secretion system protein [Verrucomicrobiota bacterium]